MGLRRASRADRRTQKLPSPPTSRGRRPPRGWRTRISAGDVAGQDVDQGPGVGGADEALDEGQVTRLEEVARASRRRRRPACGRRRASPTGRPPRAKSPARSPRAGGDAPGRLPDVPHGHPEEVEVGLQVPASRPPPAPASPPPATRPRWRRRPPPPPPSAQTASRLRQSVSFWRTSAGVIRSVDSGTLSTIWRWSQ